MMCKNIKKEYFLMFFVAIFSTYLIMLIIKHAKNMNCLCRCVRTKQRWISKTSLENLRRIANLTLGKEARNCNHSQRESAIQQLLTKYIFHPNYSSPYNLKEINRTDFSQNGEIPNLINTYFKYKKNGFFIEAGAYDGKFLSNTLQLEREQNWNGILVEPVSSSFQRLLGKNRKAYLLNACLADVCGKETKKVDGESAFAGLAILENGIGNPFGKPVPCFSIADVLSAINVTHVDWMVLDTEGSEPDILKSFPWDTVTVDLIQVEAIQKGRTNLDNIKFFKELLEAHDYEEEVSLKFDMIFRRTDAWIGSDNNGVKFGGYVKPKEFMK